MSAPEPKEDIRAVLLRELREEARTFHKLKGGRNSQVFRVTCADGAKFAAKAYFQSDTDRRDRMGNEFRALRFLKVHGLRQIPAALAADETRRVGIYEYIEGQQLQAVGNGEIDQAVEFLGALQALASTGQAAHFPAASEACFSVGAILANLEGRFERLGRAAERHGELAAFLREDIAPFRKTAEAWSGRIDPASEIPASERTLSPSDFGFHNALRVTGGRLVFLDFEYFGWDDPAKTICDFLLHPAMELAPALRARFLAGAFAAFGGARSLAERVPAVYPLFGLKWCAILLNEFTVEHLERRRFADGSPEAWSGAAQLEKARRMLAGVMHDYRDLDPR